MAWLFACKPRLIYLILCASVLLQSGRAEGLRWTHKRVDRRIYDPGICWESWGLCPPDTFSTPSRGSLSQTHVFSAQSSSSLRNTKPHTTSISHLLSSS